MGVGKRAKHSLYMVPEITLGAALVLLLGIGLYVLITPLPAAAVPVASQLFDVQGKPIAKFYTEHRVDVPLSSISPLLQNAVIAVEDYRFHEHFGVDPMAVARALTRNIRAGVITEGGSTITQQLAKNLYLSPERTVQRKLREMLLTFKLEARYSKNQILLMYLNTINFGHGAYGAEVAAQTYFGKSAQDVSLAEAALLAGMPKGPGIYSPYIDPSAALARREVVLRAMAERGYISAAETEAALNEPLGLAGLKRGPGQAPYFVDFIYRELEQRYDPEVLHQGGLKIYTTLDLAVQEAAENAFAAGLPTIFQDQQGVAQPQGALVALDCQTGAVLAMIGGRDFAQTPFNRALAPRQPGSAFKPFVYLAALENGYTAASTLVCEPISLPVAGQMPWTPTDYGDEDYHFRPMTLREALTISDNVISARLNYELGPAKGVAVAHDLGIGGPLTPHLSSVLGTNEVTPLEMAAAFAPLANGGDRVQPWAISRVENRSGKIMEEHKARLQKVADPRTVYILTDILHGVTQPGGTASVVGRTLERPAAGKTGTSQGNAWFVGYTPELVAAVYVGNDVPAQDVNGTGGGLAAPIFANFVREALAGKPVRNFTRPSGIVELDVCGESGMMATRWCPEESVYKEIFAPGTIPMQPCSLHTPWSSWQFSWPFSAPPEEILPPAPELPELPQLPSADTDEQPEQITPPAEQEPTAEPEPGEQEPEQEAADEPAEPEAVVETAVPEAEADQDPAEDP